MQKKKKKALVALAEDIFTFQHPHGSSDLLTPLSRDLMPLAFRHQAHVWWKCVYAGKTLAHKIIHLKLI